MKEVAAQPQWTSLASCLAESVWAMLVPGCADRASDSAGGPDPREHPTPQEVVSLQACVPFRLESMDVVYG